MAVSRQKTNQIRHKGIGLDLYLEHLVALLIKKDLITQKEIDDYINSILVMEKLMGNN